MHKAIQYSLIFVMIFIFVNVSLGQDAFDQTVAQIKTLEAELEEDRQRVLREIEQRISKERKVNPLNAPKDQFESDADYAVRLSKLEAVLFRIRSPLWKRYFKDNQNQKLQISQLYNRIFQTNTLTVTLGVYDANNGYFPIIFSTKGLKVNVRLRLNKEDARNLYHNWDKVIKTGYRSIGPGYRSELTMVKLEYPPLWKQGITWTVDREYHQYDIGYNNSVAFAPNGTYLATGNHEGNVSIWNMNSGERIWQKTFRGAVDALSFSPNGQYLAVADNNSVSLWEMGRGTLAWKRQNRYQRGRSIPSGNPVYAYTDILSIDFSPDGKYLATGDAFNVILWQVSNGNQVWKQRKRYRSGYTLPNKNPVYDYANILSIDFSPDGTYLATGDTFTDASLWRVIALQRFRDMNHKHHVYAVSFSPNGKYLATGSYGTTESIVTIWEMRSRQVLRQIEHRFPITAVSFSPDGQYLAVGEKAGRRNGKITFYRIPKDITIETKIAKEKVIQTSGEIKDLAWSPYGNLISDGKKVYRTLLQPEIYDIGKPAKSTVSDKP